jgi:hypothetical protein
MANMKFSQARAVDFTAQTRISQHVVGRLGLTL